jgi:sugar/nucleoside kinase (ribokinase family)
MCYQLSPGGPPGPLGVIGNISRDRVVYANGRTARLLGGAALHVAMAVTRAGLRAAPVAVIGTDLEWITSDPRLAAMDLSQVRVIQGDSCAFGLAYDDAGAITSTSSSFGVSENLTSHALDVLSSCPAWHVCCRRPLGAQVILGRLAATGMPFSADFHLASAAQLMASVRVSVPHAAAVFVNAHELAILARVIDPRTLRLIVVSDGPRPAMVLRHGEVTASALPPAVRVMEVTGGGDILAGTFLAAAAHGLGDDDALQVAVQAAAKAVAGPGLVITADGG